MVTPGSIGRGAGALGVTSPWSVRVESIGRLLVGRDEQGDLPRIEHEEAARPVLDRRAGRLGAGPHGRDVGRRREHDVPVAEPRGVRRLGRHAAAAPGVDAQVVVVAAGGEEARAAHVRGDVEADHVAVEGERGRDVADVQVEVADAQARLDGRPRRLAGDRVQQRGEVERLRAAAELLVPARPPLARAVGRELDPVAVGVGEVDRPRACRGRRRPGSGCARRRGAARRGPAPRAVANSSA